MAGLENLFATEPMLPNVQTVKMPDNAAEWAETLTTRLRELHPDASRLPLSVEFRKRDDASGTAMGAIHVVSAESGKTLFVPFVIKKFELSPLDVWMEDKTQAVHPITPDTFKEQFFTEKTDQGLDTRPADASGQYFNDPSLWTTNYPPLQGRYSYASAGYPICDNISDGLRKSDIDAMKSVLRENEHLLPMFQKRGHLELIEKLAKSAPAKDNDFVASAMKLIPVAVHSVKKNGHDKYSLLSTTDYIMDLFESQEMNREECHRFLSKITPNPQDFLHDVDQEGEKMCVMPTVPKNTVFLFETEKQSAKDANEFAAYVVKTKSGLDVEGIVIPHVISFAGKRKPIRLFISKTHCAVQDRIAGQQIPNTDVFTKCLVPNNVTVGQTGSFVFVDDGKAVATEPVTIKSVEKYGPMTAYTLTGEKIRISLGYAMSEPVPGPHKGDNRTKVKYLDVHGMIEQRPNEYVIPRRMMWIPLGTFGEVSETPAAFIEKVAAARKDAEPMRVQFTGIDYVLTGHGLEKVAMTEREAKVSLAVRGASLEKIAEIFKHAKIQGEARVHGLRQLAKKAEIIKEATNTYERLSAMAAGLKTHAVELTKLAAHFEDPATVDALLSLNFVNPDNVSKFVSYKPVFDKVLDYLAELTLASRLGLKDIPESATVGAIAKLQDVSTGLGRLSSVVRKSQTKTATAMGDVVGEKGKAAMKAAVKPRGKVAKYLAGAAILGGAAGAAHHMHKKDRAS